MSRKRIAAISAASLAGLLVLASLAAVLVLRSQWFYGRVRERIVATAESATGGRVDVGSFRFDWTRMRAEVKGFTLHGTEPAGRPPLFHAESVAVGLKIVSALKRDVDIEYLDVAAPHIYLMVYPDGRTNMPEPKLKQTGRPDALATILKLAIGRFHAQNGIFEVESRGKTPFDADARDVNTSLVYDPAGPFYRGAVAMNPLNVRWLGIAPAPMAVSLAVAIQKNRIGITSATLSTGDSSVKLSGAVDDLASPHGAFQYDARISLADAARVLRVTELERGRVEAAGKAVWSGGVNFSATGNLHAYGVDYRDYAVTLRGCRADGALEIEGPQISLSSVRFSANYVNRGKQVPAGGHIAKATLRGRDLDLRGVAVAVLGGTFEGQARLSDLKRYTVSGTVAGFEARRVIALYSSEPLPWDARASGAINLEGTLGRRQDLRAAANLEVAPAPEGAPVRGRISASYNAGGKTLDLGRSTLALPSSRIDFSGVLGREMRVRVETRDLNDFLPALGRNAASLPVTLANGSASFDGTVAGTLDDPHIAGRLAVKRATWSGATFDSLQADVTASPNSLKFDDAVIASGALRATGQAAIGPRNWKIADDSPVAASGTVRNADAGELAALLSIKNVAVAGTLAGAAQVAGTVAKPVINGNFEVTKGALKDEPFDRVTARVSYNDRRLELQAGQLTAGLKQLQFSAAYDHASGSLDHGRLHFEAASNNMPIDQIQTLAKARPGVKGTARFTARGDLAIALSGQSAATVRITDLQADVAAKGLQMGGQSLGDLRLTAASTRGLLNVRLESDFANSGIRGQGQWRLEGDYPGSATVTFSRVDFENLRHWVFRSEAGKPGPVAGYAEGELRVEGPALKPAAMKAELRVTKLEIGPAPGSRPAGVPATVDFTLRNAGPVVASLANSVVTIQSARLTGHDTDFTLGGTLRLDRDQPLDARVNGHIDLAILRDIQPDSSASGLVAVDAALRGPLDSPQVSGRVQFQNAAFSLEDFPNGIDKASGVILLSGNRATIQSFTGETGGGTVSLSGFATYSEGAAVFRVRAEARQVRVRYPEGVSTVADADLDLTGTAERSMLSGTITVLRTGFNPQSDFSSLIAKSAQPVRTPSARAGPLGGLNFDVQVNTAPDTQVQSSLTQDLQVDANLRLRGNLTNPAVIGRINITQGQVVFYGTRYNVNQGSIAFYNPVKIDPILDIDLETKARGIDVTLSVTGPLNNPKLTPRSDPPLQFQEIVALLATGRMPTSDPTLLAQQSTMPQPWQQAGATALLGEAIANPVSGRLQRFFGVSKLRIDPTLPGVENNPQARLTLEEQITPDITFTYITNVTTTNPQIVRVEWAMSKKWSVVALRDENGTFGVDFFYKKRF